MDVTGGPSKPAPPHRKQTSCLGIVAYVLAGTSFIPLLGVLTGLGAIVLGVVTRRWWAAVLGVAGILFSVVLYGGLFYFGFVANYGPYYELKKQLAAQLLDSTQGEILIFYTQQRRLPATLNELRQSAPMGRAMVDDPWMRPFIYRPEPDGTFELRSVGPDGVVDTPDDVWPSRKLPSPNRP